MAPRSPVASVGGESAPPVAAARVTGSSSAARPARAALHLVVGLLAWVAFAALWVWQLRDYRPSDFELYPVFIGATLLVLAVLGRAWIEWNRGIYRRRHNRTNALEREPDFTRDSISRPVRCEPALRYAPGQLIVDIDDGLGRGRGLHLLVAPLLRRRRLLGGCFFGRRLRFRR